MPLVRSNEQLMVKTKNTARRDIASVFIQTTLGNAYSTSSSASILTDLMDLQPCLVLQAYLHPIHECCCSMPCYTAREVKSIHMSSFVSDGAPNVHVGARAGGRQHCGMSAPKESSSQSLPRNNSASTVPRG